MKSFPLFFILLIFTTIDALAQKSVLLHGVVTDVETNEKVAFATVALSSRNGGAWTDSIGRFSFRAVPGESDSLIITYVGYKRQSIALTDQPDQVFQVKISPSVGILEEVVITDDPNPGKTLMKKVLSHNNDNNTDRVDRLDAQRWTRNEVSAVDPAAATGNQVRKGGMFASRTRAFESVKPQSDTLKGVTPLFFSEKLSTYIRTNRPFGETENVLAIKKTNLESDKMLERLARWDANINLYDERVLLFGKTFVSPVGPAALNFYDYFIQDSVAAGNGHWNITMQAIPKSWYGNVFTGMITVNDSAYALVGAELRLSKDANLNYIETLSLRENFIPVIDHQAGQPVWVLKESAVDLSYEAGLEMIGIPLPANAANKHLTARMTTRYDSLQVNNPIPGQKVKTGAVSIVRTRDTGQSDDYWKSQRPDTLSAHENAIYAMADVINSDPRQRLKDKFFKTCVEGAYTWKEVAWIGPFGSMISTNQNEGVRMRVGFRTDEALIPKTGFYGHLAYGTLDQQWKGGFGVKHLWSVQPYSKTELFAGSDYVTVTEWYDALDADNIFNSILRKKVPYRRTLQQQLTFSHEQQLGASWFMKGSFGQRKISPSFDFSYANPAYRGAEQTPRTAPYLSDISVTEATISLRFAWHERSRMYDYQRHSLGSQFPMVNVSYTKGFKLGNNGFDYQKISVGLAHTTRITPKTSLLWNAEVGKITGTLPALLLYSPRGNDTYVTSRYLFNTVVPYEFAADRYAVLQTRLAMGGLLFDHVPFLQQLGWRERLTFNSFWGDMSANNQAFNAHSGITIANGQPFMEAGAGIENIFHLFSIDYIRRINYKGPYNGSGIFVGMKVSF